jgi:predicted ATPase
MSTSIDKISIHGFKSIRSLEEFPLTSLNILIGANGSGKSNFVSFFTLLREIVEKRMQKAINKGGGADAHLFLGPKVTEQIIARLDFGMNAYGFSLEPTADNRLFFSDERIIYEGSRGTLSVNRSIEKGHSESALKDQLEEGGKNYSISCYIYKAVSNWTVYHVHDTSETAAIRRSGSVRDNEYLRAAAGNVAAFLLNMREKDKSSYEMIRDTIKLVAPFFEEFKFRPQQSNSDEIVQLEWTQKNSDYPFHASQFSDGTLRFIALATALLQPDPPATILLDEPELGMHPYALDILAGLIKQAATKAQLIISTQSASLLNAFKPEDIIVVDREAGESRFRRLSAKELQSWLEDEYTLGDLWQKNIYGGGPVHE